MSANAAHPVVSVSPVPHTLHVGHVLSDDRPQLPAQQFCHTGLVSAPLDNPGQLAPAHDGAGDVQVRVRLRDWLKPHAPLQSDHDAQPAQPPLTGQQSVRESLETPVHATPPHDATGLAHVRSRVRVEHVRSYGPHAVQPPATARNAVRDLDDVDRPAHVLP